MVRQPPLILFSNSASGSAQGDRLLALWRELVPSYRRSETFILEPEAEFDALLTRALLYCERCNGVLVVAGGDGTISSVINKIAGRSITMAVVPQGTFNFFARNYNIPLEPDAALRFVLSAEPVTLPLACLNDRSFVVSVGLGLYPKVIAARESHQQVAGRSGFSAIVSGVWTLLRERHISRAKLHYNGNTQRLATPLLMVIHNRRQLEQLDSRFQGDPQRLAVLRVHPVSFGAMLRLLANGLLGRLLDEENIDCFNTDELRVEIRRRRVQVALDGELIKMRLPLRFHIRRHGVRCLLNGDTS
ncbi:diacylglycerol/lipid kinase family protein [Exilibacterium tricleocarpae]|uniref:diacylglycerol/lipid kinase family protein n=1 Tax=Exilibacterium tricleocarpae TaxID=2591008 RepID=UPI0015D14AEF|nr:diacylglycerol kinase family protein [Exilibacterium tricleocarpae]